MANRGAVEDWAELDVDVPTVPSERHLRNWVIGTCLSLLLLAVSIALAFSDHGWIGSLSIVFSGMFLEVLIGAAASVPLGFHPIAGALIAGISNLAPVPILIASFDWLIHKWMWLRRRLRKVEKLSDKWGKYGVFALVVCAPLFGVYVTIGIGATLRLRPWKVLVSITIGVLATSFLITLFGSFLRGLF